MRRLFAFLVWLFSFWTWKNFFLRWHGSVSSYPAKRETAKHVLSENGEQESKLARFLSSLPKERRICQNLHFKRDSKVIITFGRSVFRLFHGTGAKASFGDFVEATASSKIVFGIPMFMRLWGDNSFKHVEVFADALRKSDNKIKELHLTCIEGSSISFAKCISSVILGNDAIQDLRLHLVHPEEEMGKELAAELMANIAMPHNLRILKSFEMGVEKVDGEGMEQLMKPFLGPPSVLEDLSFYSLTSNAQLQHISGMLASSKSLKSLIFSKNSSVKEKTFMSGYNSIGVALGSNQSLESLSCEISNSMELEVLLEPLMPKNNNLQRNTTLSELQLENSRVGKEGIETLVHMLCTNTSLLELDLDSLDDLSLHDAQGVENVLAILEALKTNKSLQRISFIGCEAVGGYQVLGAMMDLLLENHNIQDIYLGGTGLERSGDADYVTSALSKKNKMKMWDVVQSMATVNPTSGRVFLCGQPYAEMMASPTILPLTPSYEATSRESFSQDNEKWRT